MAPAESRLNRPFFTVWLGQTVSEVGTTMSGVAAAVYIFLETGSATWLGLISAITVLPAIAMGVAGSLIDKHPRRRVMIWGDIVAATSPALALMLALSGRLEVWHLVVAGFVASAGNAAQIAASQAAIPALVEPAQLDRAHSMRQLGTGLGVVIGPAIATPLLVRWGIEAVLLVDLATFVVGIAAVAAVRFDDPDRDAAVEDDGSWHSMLSWLRGPGSVLLALMVVGAALNLTLAFFNLAILVAVTLVAGAAKTGLVLGLGGVAMVLGSVVAAGIGSSQDRAGRIAVALGIVGIGFGLAGLRPSIWLQTIGVSVALAAVPVVGATFGALFNERVPPQMQGRVFALRGSLSLVLQSVGALTAGLVVAYVAEPAMRSGVLSGSLGRIIGTGESSGAALVLIASGLALITIAIALLGSSLRAELQRPTVTAGSDPPVTLGANATRPCRSSSSAAVRRGD